MKNITRVLALLIFLFSSFSANALIVSKADHPQAAPAVHLHNALTDVSLTQTHSEDEMPPYVHINLADAPDGPNDRASEHSHGMHVTGIVFLSIAATFLLGGSLIALSGVKSTDGGTLNFIGAIVCGLVAIGFAIPGAILLARYSHNKTSVKEKE